MVQCCAFYFKIRLCIDPGYVDSRTVWIEIKWIRHLATAESHFFQAWCVGISSRFPIYSSPDEP